MGNYNGCSLYTILLYYDLSLSSGLLHTGHGIARDFKFLTMYPLIVLIIFISYVNILFTINVQVMANAY